MVLFGHNDWEDFLEVGHLSRSVWVSDPKDDFLFWFVWGFDPIEYYDCAPRVQRDFFEERIIARPERRVADDVGDMSLLIEKVVLASAWPIQPEEQAIIPAADTRDWDQWKKPAAIR